VPRRHLTIAGAGLALILLAAGCSSRMPILNPEPRTHQAYAHDRDECVRKHSFGLASAHDGRCVHCELYVLCMERSMWKMGPDAGADTGLPCCRGTAKALAR
jgi:hypothetical protein